MKKAGNKIKRAFIGTAIVITIILVLVIVLISPIAKYVIEKYSVKYTGRQIKVDWVYLNPFTGYMYASNLKVYENKSDSLFITIKGLSTELAIMKLFHKTYEISHVTLNEPWIRIIQNNKVMNFQDIIEHFTPKGPPDTTKEPVHFNILGIKINNGEFHYIEQSISVNYFIKNVDIQSNGKWWNNDTMNFKFSFESGPGSGTVNGDCLANMKNADYHLKVLFNHFDLKVFEQYLHDFANYGNFSANMDANIDAKGNFSKAVELDAKGQLTVNDFHIGKVPGNDYASFNKFTIGIFELNPKNHKYFFDSLSLISPFVLYERYDSLDNIEMMFGKKGSNITSVSSIPDRTNVLVEIARYVKTVATNFFASDFKINRLAIYKGDLRFNDYSLHEKFAIDMDPMNIIADSIYKSRDRVHLLFKAAVKPYGNASVALSMNPKSYGDFDMTYSLDDLPASLFNPYTITYTSFPLNRGTIDFNGSWTVRNGIIKSTNHLLVIDPYTTKRIRRQDTKWLPLPLILAFVRERGNVIDYEIPITGDLNNPKYHLKYVLFDLLSNVFIKPPTIPYGAHVSETENEIHKSLTLTWNMRQASLQPEQERFVKKMVGFLKKSPKTSISIFPVQYSDKEKEYILFYEAKKKYFLLVNGKSPSAYTVNDSLQVDKMSIKDPAFVRYLNKYYSTPLTFTIQEKCDSFVGKTIVNAKFNQLVNRREINYLSYLKKEGIETQVRFHQSANSIPYDGFSYYKIDYNGDIPDELKTAYMEMYEMNEGWFRRKYKNIRKEIKAKYEKEFTMQTKS
ncbi:MAG TPA: DUF748 domain-containing protein [Bacteroidia bacterium]|jgi:hypothetical protein|nr:DUF748 domain-containing protein [Bacteroidia bacterium]